MITPPYHIESEQSIIGILLTSASAFDDISEIIDYSDFYDANHSLIFISIAELASTGSSIDVITLAEKMGESRLEQIGGLPYLVNLAHSYPSKSGLRQYVENVKEKSQLRKLAAICNQSVSECFDDRPKKSSEIAADIESEILKIASHTKNEAKHFSDLLLDAIEYVENRSDCSGLKTGLDDLDKRLGGLEGGDLLILAGRPSMGKSALAVNIADNVSHNGKSVMLFSLEMPDRQIALRIMAARSGKSMESLRSGDKFTDSELDMLAVIAGKAKNQNLLVDDKPAVSVAYIRSKARQYKNKYGLDMIVIDYLQLMTGKGDNRTQEVGGISRGLKALAKELNIPIIALAQLNRGLEDRANKRPVMSDLRDSGEIEQDADIVLMLYRDEVYDDRSPHKGLAELIIRKQRNGALGTVFLTYRGAIMRFDNHFGEIPELNIQKTKRGYSYD